MMDYRRDFKDEEAITMNFETYLPRNALDYVQRINHVAFALGHFLSMEISNHSVKEHFLETKRELYVLFTANVKDAFSYFEG